MLTRIGTFDRAGKRRHRDSRKRIRRPALRCHAWGRPHRGGNRSSDLWWNRLSCRGQEELRSPLFPAPALGHGETLEHSAIREQKRSRGPDWAPLQRPFPVRSGADLKSMSGSKSASSSRGSPPTSTSTSENGRFCQSIKCSVNVLLEVWGLGLELPQVHISAEKVIDFIALDRTPLPANAVRWKR